jgi:hypothetical protein
LLPDTLAITLAPDRIVLQYRARRVSWRGLRSTPHAEQVLAYAPADANDSGVLARLESVLGDYPKTTRAVLTLSNQWVRYTLVPWSDALSNAQEEAAYARHCFNRIYGEVAAHWTLRINPARDGMARLASAVDSELLAALRALFARSGQRLQQIQPLLMAAYNQHQRALARQHAWFAVLEPGNLCLLLLNNNQCLRVRSLPIDADWQTALPRLLAREVLLCDPAAATQRVLISAAQARDWSVPQAAGWQFELLANTLNSAPPTLRDVALPVAAGA